MIRVYASESPRLYEIAEQLAQLANVHLFWDLRDMAEVERRAAVAELVAEFEELCG
jgi:hypothetical protein